MGRAAAAIVAVLAVAGLVGVPPAEATTPTQDEWYSWCAINAERRQRGIPPVLMSSAMQTQVARPWAAAMGSAALLVHRSVPDLRARTTAAVGTWDRVSENIGRYTGPYANMPELHQLFMRSPTHAGNVLDRRMEYVGIGVTHRNGIWAAQNFVSSSRQQPTTAMPQRQPFVDVCTDHPFFEEIRWMYETGISTGYRRTLANGHPYRDYRPTATTTRAAMSAFLHRVAGEPAVVCPPTYPFTDVAANEPFRNQICWMHTEGLTGDAATFSPGAPTDRGAMADWMYRLWQSTDDGHVFEVPTTATFGDVPLSDPHFEAVEWMAAVGVSTGFTDGTYRPDATVTRMAMSAFFERFQPLL